MYNKKVMKLILASSSPRRRELMEKVGYPFDVIPSNCEEICSATVPQQMVQQLAELKANEVFTSHPDCVVIGSDTVVDLNGQVLGKPKDDCNATKMLKSLSGATHQVHTGVCVLSPVGRWLFCDTTDVHFRALTDDEIAHYVASGYADGKAGAYGIQDCNFVTHYVGDFDNVVGLPVYKVKEILDKIYKR